MAFLSLALITLPAVPLAALGAVMLRAGGGAGEGACRALRTSGAAFLCLGAGFAVMLAAPDDARAPLRILGDAALILPYGLLWRAARALDGRRCSFEAVSAGTLAWLLAAAFFDPSQAWRVAVTSAAVAAYSVLAAREHRRGAALPARRWAARAFACHGAVFALRAVLGPTLGVAGGWGALLGLETVLASAVIGAATLALGRERPVACDRHKVLQDALTGLGNRRALDRSGAALLAAAAREGRPAALLLMDLDGFGAVNEAHGRPAGDRLLVAFARLAHDYLPPNSLVCRLGGEAFAAVLPGADADRALAVADEIRALFAHLRLDGPAGPVRTTVSVGVSLADGARADLATMLGRAGACLGGAKRAGRDRVVVEDVPPATRAPPPAHPWDVGGASLARPPAGL